MKLASLPLSLILCRASADCPHSLARVSAYLRRWPALASVFVVIESEKGSELDIMLGEDNNKMKQN